MQPSEHNQAKGERRHLRFDPIVDIIATVSHYIQYFIALVIIVAIILSFWSLPQQFLTLFDVGSESLIEFLKYAINMIIALELVRVLCHQTLDTIVEILLMAVTRELIISHLKTWEILVGVLAVAVLFAIRKYLYISKLDHSELPKALARELQEEDSAPGGKDPETLL